VTIPDLSTVESSIAVSGCSGNASSTSTAEVLNRSGGSADNVDQIFTVNVSTEARNGTWKLRVQDAAAQDTGFIISWTLTL
jgi:subtilisin-like proprotein convertase family protein